MLPRGSSCKVCPHATRMWSQESTTVVKHLKDDEPLSHKRSVCALEGGYDMIEVTDLEADGHFCRNARRLRSK